MEKVIKISKTQKPKTEIKKMTELFTEQPQDTIKSIIRNLQDMTFKAHNLSAGDIEVFGSLVSEELDRILEFLGIPELSITAEVKDKLPATTVKKELRELHDMNGSMFTTDPNYIPRFTDGTPIRPQDLADMNIRSLEYISELLGFELE